MKINKFEETKRALVEEGIPHELIKHPPIKTVEEGLAYLKIQPDQGVSTLIFKTERGFGAVLRRDDHQIDYEKVKMYLNTQTVMLCTPEEIRSVTGCDIGYISPYNPGIQMLMDETILEKDSVYLGTGSSEYDLKITPSNLLQFTKAIKADIVQKGVMRKSRAMTKNIPSGKRIYSAIAPSGDGTLHIGNYLGAVKQFIELAKHNECFLQLATIHALTTVQDGKQLAKNIETLTLNELALLGDNPNIHFCYQSDIPYHTELQSLLNNVTPLGLLKRAHAYKDKLAKDTSEDDINLGLFNYPILMAADILIYKATLVPVGKDQKQHVEITRDIAERFNKIFKKNVFPLPDPYIPEEVAVVLGTDGKRKMSKSLGNIISIFESEEVIKKQVMGTYTDPTRKHASDPGHVEGNMVFTYLEFFGEAGKAANLKKRYQEGSVGDVEVKEYLFESLLTFFGPARKKYEELKNNPKLVTDILERGRARAMEVASETMGEVREAVGLVTKYNFANFTRPPLANAKGVALEEFARIEIRVGKVLEATNKEGSDKLIRLVVNIGTDTPRIIFTGVRGYGYTPEDFLGKHFFFITNLAYRKMLDEESQGMILAVDGTDKKPQFVSAEGMSVGATIR